jgi:hypothetical protein
MKCLAVALMFATSAVTAATADESCKDQAVANKFRGDEFKSFMVNCKVLMEIACEGRAIDQKVSDDAKDSFIKQCIKDAVGSKYKRRLRLRPAPLTHPSERSQEAEQLRHTRMLGMLGHGGGAAGSDELLERRHHREECQEPSDDPRYNGYTRLYWERTTRNSDHGNSPSNCPA